ncbi:MAG: peptidoglycan-binding domain-containing protein [Patescibacteria group bacterium]
MGNKKEALVIFSAAALISYLWLLIFFSGGFNYAAKDAGRFLAAVFFPERTSEAHLAQVYKDARSGAGKVNILIVPGHDSDSFGTSYRGLTEAEVTAVLGERLEKLFKDNTNFRVSVLRTSTGYNPAFLSYIRNERSSILSFMKEKRKIMSEYVSQKRVEKIGGVPHVSVSLDTAIKLYGTNMWADALGTHIVIHLHFNDYPRESQDLPGKYSGFAVYVPDGQYGNAAGSRAVAEKVFARLARSYHTSTYPKESAGVVPDQRLIALGANDTLSSAVVLIEYGYFYEPQFTYEATRNRSLDDLALKTYAGVLDFFGETAFFAGDSALLPYRFDEDLKKGDRGKVSVMSLQAALSADGLYPPAGKNKNECPLSGSFQDCTQAALLAFQKREGLPGDGSIAGPATREVLNRRFSSGMF